MTQAMTQAITMSVPKTAAEDAISDYFANIGETLPGAAQVAATRTAAMTKFEQLGLPHRRIEEWKYTDLRSRLKTAFAPARRGAGAIDNARLTAALGAIAEVEAVRLVLVDGQFAPDLSDHGAVAPGTTFMALAAALGDTCFVDLHARPNAAIDDHAVGALNTAFMSDGVALMIARSPAKPLHIVHVSSATEESAVATRNIITVMDGVEATILESHVAIGTAAVQTNALTHLGLADSASVDHIKLQHDGDASTHLSTWLIDLHAASLYRGFQFSVGAGLARNQININFKGANATADVSGINLLNRQQHCDTTMVIDHGEPGCTSRELFKLVLDDQARGVFQGKVVVHANAQKTDGKQMAQALMLSHDCEFDSKPELEIYADDVACGHGSTCAELDEDLIFYCRSRGIPEATAHALLIESFIGEALDKVGNAAVRAALQQTAQAWLGNLQHEGALKP